MEEITIHSEKDRFLYGPAAVLNAFANSLNSPLLNEQFNIKGIYKKGKGVNYNGFYYDILKDEYTDANLTLVTPAALRSKLSDGQLIEAVSFLSKRLSAAVGRIDIMLNLADIISNNERVINEDEVAAFKLIQLKAKIGYKDIDQIIKHKLYEQSHIRVVILVGTTAVIDHDVKHQLRDAVSLFDVSYIKVNMTKPDEIVLALKTHEDCDLLVIARGGGENMQVFDNLRICEQSLSIKPAFVTALGHAVDEPLLQKIADKHFITPTALGQYFHDIYIRTLEDLNNSKAKLIDDLSKQIGIQYQAKLQDLTARLQETSSQAQETKNAFEQKMQTALRDWSKTKSINAALFTIIILLSLFMIYFFLLAPKKI